MSLWQQNYSRFSASYLLGRHHHDLDILNNSSLNFARPESLASHTAQTAVARRELREQPRLKIDTDVYNVSPSQYARRWQHNNNSYSNNNNNSNSSNNSSSNNNDDDNNTSSSRVKPTSLDIPSHAVDRIIPSTVHSPPNCEPKSWWPQQQSHEHKLSHFQEDDLTRAHIKRHKVCHPLSDKYKGEQLKPGVHAVRFAIDTSTDESIQSVNSSVASPQDIEMQSQELRINDAPFIRRASATEQGSYAYFSAPANTNPLLSVTLHNPADDNRHALNAKPISGNLNGKGFNGIGMGNDKQTAENPSSNNLTSNTMNATPSLSPCSSTSSLNSTGAMTPATAMMDKSHDAYSGSQYQDSLYSGSPSNLSSQSSPFLTASYLPQGFQTNPFTENPTNTNSLASSHSSVVRPKAKSISVENPSSDRRRVSHHSFSCPAVTRDSYSSVPWSPAVSFLANLADATVKAALPDDEGQQVKEYILGKVIGRGGFSTVREAYDGMDKLAVKIVKNNTESPDNDRVQTLLEREITIWRALDHPNVVKMVSVEETDYATFVFAEHCSGGTLLNYIKSYEKEHNRSGIPESMAHEIFKQIASSVRYLHKDMRLVHKDIKLDNILYCGDGTWKLCDFGLTEFQNTDANGFGNVADDNSEAGGSLAYCPPEQLKSTTSIRNPRSDIWSLGVVLYAMLTGQLPFNDDFQPRLQFKILNGRYDESLLDDANVSDDCKDLLRRMFKPKPEQRIDITEVMNSSWYLREI